MNELEAAQHLRHSLRLNAEVADTASQKVFDRFANVDDKIK